MKAKLATRPARPLGGSRSGALARRVATRHNGRRLPTAPAALDATAIVRLQAIAGNEAVGELLRARAPQPQGQLLAVQLQAVACPPPPAPLVPADPQSDPKFKAVTR